MIDIFENENFVLKQYELSKSGFAKVASQVIGPVIAGEVDALQTFIKAKGLLEIATVILDGVKEEALNEASKYSKEDKVLGCGFLVKSVANTYDYSNNEEWSIINEKINELKAVQKEIEKKMVIAMGYSEMVDKDGVVIVPAVIKKAGGDTLQINIPK
jgi:3-phosphoglycerate kinase